MYDPIKIKNDRMHWNARPAPGIKNGTEFHVKWVNYVDSGKNWTPINCELNQLLTGFEIEHSPFYFKAPRLSASYTEMIVNNRYNVFQKTEIATGDFSNVTRCLGVENVQGQLFDINNNGCFNAVIYPGAYASSFNGDLIHYIHQGRAPELKKLVRFNSTPITDIALKFEREYSEAVEIAQGISINEIWNGNGQLNQASGFYVKAKGGERGIGMRPPIIWDSSVDLATGGPKVQEIQCYLEKSEGNKYTLTKIIPKSFFIDAVFPVYTDATSTFYPDPGSGSTTSDSAMEKDDAVWDNTHNASSSTNVYTSATTITATCGHTGGGLYRISRMGLTFDTSSIGAGASVTSAIYSGYATSILNGNNDGDDWVVIVESSPANDNNWVLDDYDQVGAVHGATEISARKDLTGLSTGQYHDFDLTDLSVINKTSITRLGMRGGNDILDIVYPGTGTSNWFRQSSADEPGTSQDPKLVVVYSAAAIMNQFQGPNLGADLFNGVLL